MKRILLAAMLLSLGACGNLNEGDGGEGVAAVQPSRVTEAELRAAATDPRLVRFYEARNWQPAWNSGTAAALVEAINGATEHALDPQAFLVDATRSDAPALRDVGLSLAALGYAEALARGRVDPKRVRDSYEIPRPDAAVADGLNAALEQGNVGEWLASLAPQDDEYRRLSAAYVAAVRQAGSERPATIPDGAVIRPGASDPRLPAIAAALRAQDYLSAPAEPPAQAPAKAQPRPGQGRYTSDLVEAVRRLQQDYGLDPSGTIGAETLAALNHVAFYRARTWAVNLERRRWLPREAAATRIDVNIAAAFLTYWRDGRIADQRVAVVGQPGNETPELASPMFRLVAHPTWTVPRSIEEEEIAPRGEAYLRRNNMVRRNGMIVQLPGPDNALGQVKFDMHNDQAIYLHDTPAKALFAQDRRHFSHGCVRVHDALGFARIIAEHEGVLDDWQEAQAKEEETFVALPRQIPVRLFYHTAFVESGRVRFRPDVYGLDEDVAEALGLAARPRRAAPVHAPDVGP